MDLKKLVSIIVIMILIINIALYAFLRYSELIFWGIIVVGFIISMIIRKKNK